jgi:hypothetical protein
MVPTSKSAEGSGTEETAGSTLTEKFTSARLSCAVCVPPSAPPSSTYVPEYVPNGSVSGLASTTSNRSISPEDWPPIREVGKSGAKKLSLMIASVSARLRLSLLRYMASAGFVSVLLFVIVPKNSESRPDCPPGSDRPG